MGWSHDNLKSLTWMAWIVGVVGWLIISMIASNAQTDVNVSRDLNDDLPGFFSEPTEEEVDKARRMTNIRDAYTIGALTILVGLTLFTFYRGQNPEVARRPCPECAEQIAAEAKKCRFCGAEVQWSQPRPPGETKEAACIRCAKPIAADSRFCMHCGTARTRSS